MLSISSLLIFQLRHPFSSTLAEVELATISGLVSAGDEAKRISFDLWPDIDATFDYFMNNLRLHSNSLIESF